ncbi:MAG: lysophospholipid acyltransferase family protein [Gammaproteobacteria bacterium]|nr:lysophospholipid acyltransferase family protein [Gammaproteobacteria bacterium]
MNRTEFDQSYNPFRLDDLLFTALPNPVRKPLLVLSERLLGLDRLARGYEQLTECDTPDVFAAQALQYLNVAPRIVGGDLAHIPSSGPVVVVANHPFGGMEGVVMTLLLRSVRPDVRIMANSLLKRIPELDETIIGVNPYGHRGAVKKNIAPLREALRWLKSGGLLLVFPAGDVSRFHPQDLTIRDSRWDATIAWLVRASQAQVVPVHFSGRNSLLFHSLGLLHPLLRSLMLPRELDNKRDRAIDLHIGDAISPRRLVGKGNDDEIAKYLRLHTCMLPRPAEKAAEAADAQAAELAALAPAVDSALLAAEVAALPAGQRLAESGDLKVFYARSNQLPWLLQELGRLRELTFRDVGEGTGKASDIDLYDSYYLHLFIWNAESREVVGAYRLGLADEITQKYGKKGLYSHSLFRYSKRLLRALNPAIELGRSFVRPEYQRSFTPLMLLWKGIGQFVAHHPHYAVLFGPVSISNDYSSTSQQLLIDFLRANNYDERLSRHIRPRKPYRGSLRPVWRKADLAGMGTIDEVSELVSLQESGGKGVPILIKQYLKLGGRMLGFNVDRSFNDCIDGLIMVDLRQTDERVLQKYMGKEGAQAFLAGHSGPGGESRHMGSESA